MPTTPGQIRTPKSSEAPWIFGCLGIGATIVGTGWAALHLAGGQTVPANPITAAGELARGQVLWSTTATVWAVAIALVIAAVAVAMTRWWYVRRGQFKRVDAAAQYLGRGKDIETLTGRAVQIKADELGVIMPTGPENSHCSPGVPIGGTLRGSVRLFGSFEDMHVDIWGPRMGKSTSRIIRAICEAPGAVLATENKRGNLDHTRYVREHMGRAVWVFDPQQVAQQPATFYWNPLSYILDPRSRHDPAATDGPDAEERAASLAEQFASGGDGQAVKKDPYFDPEGQDLLANLLLASALAGEQITVVYERLTRRDRCEEAVQILRPTYPYVAGSLQARLRLAAKQQDGIFGTALKMAACLRSSRVKQWITTSPGDTRPHLDLHQFVRGSETLYCLSKEGVGSTGPLIAALTVAACEAAEEIATASPGGRLPTPMLCALDEAANVVRWQRLPALYSHYGSRGINIMTVLQSWAQGVEVWGKDGMSMLWSAANVRVYGGNVSDDSFLEFLSKLVGDYDRESTSVSRSKGSNSTSTQISRERLFNISDLASWPRGRALVFSAGNPATIAKTIPWMDTPYAGLIKESLARYAPPRTAKPDVLGGGRFRGLLTHSSGDIAQPSAAAPTLTKGTLPR
ncbi:type IV secretory pathway TraG/TraD family ATPase VirD4 [Williamsia limnetica]|uniref:Type IV secretory pathway TraG/TraD family ATPase VirD4 n=1 Tax=Williamsia limnetica TaxID=882452 RepID=A0A318RDP4_WILLI|nr:TraM recognition domain-containing protein [Williamsia limnetica]PYE12020.1 type IV secretory pathway TraG/TraD family ATPase VirD4 [Williamsia limnetica]